ncbi:hypothetical protein [Dapis sp. BLCC M229]|uniref:hypothetical protein n=1 Tax=Dapis sp. BLCC M229 TaxID=3400188 RepID=UPI003CEB4552
MSTNLGDRLENYSDRLNQKIIITYIKEDTNIVNFHGLKMLLTVNKICQNTLIMRK